MCIFLIHTISFKLFTHTLVIFSPYASFHLVYTNSPFFLISYVNLIVYTKKVFSYAFLGSVYRDNNLYFLVHSSSFILFIYTGHLSNIREGINISLRKYDLSIKVLPDTHVVEKTTQSTTPKSIKIPALFTAIIVALHSKSCLTTSSIICTLSP